jgi:outer membrane receptor protein involved in Fe transport
VGPINDRRSWQKLITRFNIQWQATPDVLLYVNRSEGFRSGGFSIRGTLSEQQATQNNCGVVGGCPDNNFLSFLPETNTTYEGGIKTRFLNRAITFNAAGFINDITNFQQSQVVVTPNYGPGTNTYVVSFPKVQIKGLEFELDFDFGKMTESMKGLSLSGTLGIQDANVKNGKVNGQRIPLSDNSIVEGTLGKIGLASVEDLIHEIVTVGAKFKQANNFLWPFKLSSPKKGFAAKRHPYQNGGAWGNREELINELIKRML